MNLDGITLNCIVSELQQNILGGAIRQIYQPEKETVTLHIWTGQEQVLLISTSNEARMHLTKQQFGNPQKPPDFCMLLRKYLKGGIIYDIKQPGLERTAYLYVRRKDDEYILSCELFGRANLILIKLRSNLPEGKYEKILGGLKQRAGERAVLPHQEYHPPPAQNKLNPLALGKGDLKRVLEKTEGIVSQDEQLWRALLKDIDGIGPRMAREISIRAGIDPSRPTSSLEQTEFDRLWQSFGEIFIKVAQGSWQPFIYYEDSKEVQPQPVDCAPFALEMYKELHGERRESISAALDEYYSWQRREAEFERPLNSLKSLVRGKISRLEKTLGRVRKDLKHASMYNDYKAQADQLMANLDKIKKGDKEVELEDFVSEEKRKILLDPSLSPVENAQRLYKRYKKLKRGQEKLAKREVELEMELKYLQEVEGNLERADDVEDLIGISAELKAEGYIKEIQGERERVTPSGPHEFTVDGYKIMVGRNGKQNDELIRQATKTDLWLHAKDMPGAHVIIKTGNRPERVPEPVLYKAAQLAAYYSKGRDAIKVPVMYTLVKYLRKPKGARPGLVICQKEEGTIIASSVKEA